MKKCTLFILTLIIISLLTINFTFIYASADDLNIYIEYFTNTVKISGAVQGTETWVTCYVHDPNNKLVYIGNVNTQSNGEYSISFGVNEIVIGIYTVTIKAEGMDTAITGQVYIENFDYWLNVTVVQGEVYQIPIYKTSNITSFQVNFDSEYFEVDNSYIASAGVQIFAIGTDYIQFNYNGNQNFVDIIPLRSLKSGNTRIGVRTY